MDKRRRILIVVTAVAAAAFLLDKAVSALVFEPLQKINQDMAKTEAEIKKANTVLNTEEAVKRAWTKIRDRLDEPRPPDIHTNFLAHLGDHFEKVGVAYDVNEIAQPAVQGDFKEYIFDTRFKLTWPQFIDLLVELHNSKEFLKVSKVVIQSQYEKEDHMVVDLRVSTIEYSPKGGIK